MTRAELTPAGVMCPEETVGFIAKGCEYVQWRSKTGALDIPAEHSLEILSPGFPFSPGSFLSSFLQHSLEILLLPPHRCPGVPLPFPSSAPSSDFPVPTRSLLPSARSCQVFPLTLVLLFSLVCGCIISLVRSLLLQPL